MLCWWRRRTARAVVFLLVFVSQKLVVTPDPLTTCCFKCSCCVFILLVKTNYESRLFTNLDFYLIDWNFLYCGFLQHISYIYPSPSDLSPPPHPPTPSCLALNIQNILSYATETFSCLAGVSGPSHGWKTTFRCHFSSVFRPEACLCSPLAGRLHAASASLLHSLVCLSHSWIMQESSAAITDNGRWRKD